MQVSHKNNNNNKHNNKNRETVMELLGRYWIVVGVNDLQPMAVNCFNLFVCLFVQHLFSCVS